MTFLRLGVSADVLEDLASSCQGVVMLCGYSTRIDLEITLKCLHWFCCLLSFAMAFCWTSP